MKHRPVGVIISAVVLGLAALGLLGMALLSVVVTFMAPHMPAPVTANGAPPPPPAFITAVMAFSAVFYFVLAGWAGATIAGLVKMRSWARVSAIVIGAGLILMGIFSVIGAIAAQMMVGTMPLPAPADPRALRLVFVMMAVFSIAIIGVGIWWVVYFALRSTREAFRAASSQQAVVQSEYRPVALPRQAGPVTDFSVAQPLVSEPPHEHVYIAPATQMVFPPAETPSRTPVQRGRPVSVTVIAILLLVGSFLALLQMASPMPLFFLGVVLSGWPAHITVLMWCAVCGVAGLGLLKLQKPAWMLAVGCFSVTILNALVLALPGSRAHFREYMQSVSSRSSMGLPAPQFGPQLTTLIVSTGMVFALLYAVTLIVLLWRARWAFEPVANDQAAV